MSSGLCGDELAGVDCCGCIVVKVEGTNTELKYKECGAVVGSRSAHCARSVSMTPDPV
jgi:hypothetical protein